ncbi:MAG TPA: fused MFS/spermidine synthase [Burkholderiales bacterium]|nr:fused MFS/spermidine synthase [Burkholderiales bacterium]
MIYAATIFLSSFLLFLVQPLIARLILPWFGGSAAVWTTCMLFFQVMLLAGYGYAHFLTRKLAASKLERIVHTLLLLIALALLPIAPSDSWKPMGEEEPISRILLLLLATVGLPYFLLAATSPLLQAWFVRARPGQDPYRLFAISNLASLLALIGYPFVVEPFLSAHEQVTLWSWLFAGFALLCAVMAWRTPRGATDAETTHRSPAPSRGRYALWLGLAAAGSALLLAVTNHLTQNVASVPLLWLAPLTLYLLTFIVTFEGRSWYQPKFLWPLILGVFGVMAWMLVDQEHRFDLAIQLAVFLPGLFIACFFCHGELYRSRPAPEHLTAFYLTVSAGGALGGLAVAVIAPLIFNGYYELGVGLVAAALLAALRFKPLGIVPGVLAAAVLLGVTAGAAYDGLRQHEDVLVAKRGFYGVLRVKEYGTPGEANHLRRLVHGTIMHGEQYLHESQRRMLTTYYQETAGIGLAIASKQGRPIRVGVIGLGTGTIAAYGRKGDVFRFYEIDPHVLEIARRDFSYLGDSPAKIEAALGDARLSLEREQPQGFDVLAVDAVSSDAIPVHLITREALGIFLKHVKPDGIVAFHVSNRFLDLIPVVARIAREQGAHAVLVRDDPEDEDDSLRSRTDWVLVSRDEKALQAENIVEGGGAPAQDRPEWRSWTDDYSNLVQILK